MKKFSLLIGTLGGAMAGYLFSNKKLREELSGAKDAEAAARLLGRHLQHDGKKFAGQVKEFVSSDEVQANLAHIKKFAQAKATEAKKELAKLVGKGKKKAVASAKRATKKAKRAVKKVL